MNKKYSISFFIVILLLITALGIGYQMSYDRAKQEFEARYDESEEHIVAAEGDAVKQDGYYLLNRKGYVTVYLSDKTTVYEETDILCDLLPEEVQEELQSGKYIQTTEEVYGFLENYSS